KPGDLVIIKRNIFDKELNKKLLSKNIGPYEVVASDVNNIPLHIPLLDTQIFHQDDIDAYKGPLKPFPPHLFTPLLSEIIPIPILPRMKKANEKLLPDRMKELTLKSIVGRRISAYWPSTKSNYDGTVIGYNTELTHNLVFYDTPTIDMIASCDYYKAFLFPSSPNSRVEKWSLYS